MAKWQRFRLEIPKEYSPVERIAIANDVVEFIQDRSKEGLDKNNESFPSYTEEYKDSKNFSIAGKSSTPNLSLTGDMLNELDLLSHRSGTLLIGYESGDDINGKVEGNVIGSYGKKSGDSEKARDFMGIEQKDLDKILKKYPKKTSEDKKTTRQRAIELVSILREAREGLD